MSDYGIFESDEAAQDRPQAQARTAARHLEAAISEVRNNFGRFLLGATGIDEFEDRWHLSKHDIRASVESHVFPNTGTMRRIQNAMKADWKLAHPYKLAEDRDAPIQDIQETFTPSSGNLIPDGNFDAYEDSVDQGGPEKVQRDFTPGGDSGSDKHARRRVARDPRHYDTVGHEYDSINEPAGSPELMIDEGDQQGVHDYYRDMMEEPPVGYPRRDRSFFEDEKNVLNPNRLPIEADGTVLARREAAALVADIYTDFARSNGMRVASLDTLDRYASTGIHEADYRLLESMIVRTAECDEDCDDDDEKEAPKASEGDENEESDSSDSENDFGGESDAEGDYEGSEDDDESDSDGGDEDYDFGGDDEGGDESGGGQQYTVPDQAPDLDPQMLNEIPHENPQGAAPVPPEVVDSLLGLPPGTIEQLLLEEVQQGQGGDQGMSGAPMPPQGGAPQGGGEDFFGGGGDDTEQEPPRVARRRRVAGEFRQTVCADCGQDIEGDVDGDGSNPFLDRGRNAHGSDGHEHYPEEWTQRYMEGSRRRSSARRFWAAEDEPSGGDSGGGESAAPPAQDPAAAGGAPPVDPNAMGGMQQPMLPPPGSQAVAPPAPAMPLENQPAEDALLDTANQAIMQMIDQETAEYQQIIDPLSQALQAIQFAQQVEQTEHPMDVTPPQGTVNVDPSQAPGGAQNPMQPTASRQFWAAEDGEKLCYHPRSCSKCDNRGGACGAHVVGSEGHERCSGNGNRQAKIRTALRNATRVIAQKYRLSATGERMLLEAMGRRNYEHVREALSLVPPEVRKPAAIHMGEMFAADNARFNKDAWIRSVLASNPRDRAGDAWRDGRDRGEREHGEQDMEDDWKTDFDPEEFREQVRNTGWAGPLDGRQASRGRLPFDSARHTAGETWAETPTKDAFEFPNAGQVPRVSDNNTSNELPVMKGADPHGKNAASQKAVDRFQRWQQRQQQKGLSTTEGESAVHNFLQTSNPIRNRVGPEAQDMIHRDLGLNPDSVHAPRATPLKAVNPTLKGKGGTTPAAPTAKSPAPKAAPKTASFFTRRVPGWRWDDHLSGYLSKEARNFTCSCGDQVSAPSYRNCRCGKIWNVYAIGDTHHLGSNTADMFIAREIPVRDNVIMANRKMAAGDEQSKSHRELLAEIERLADWTKYDGPDPARAMGKSKPPSTSIAKQPQDWAKRTPDGTWQGPAIPHKKK